MEPLFVQPAVMISNARIQTVTCKIENQNAINGATSFIEVVFYFFWIKIKYISATQTYL